MAGFDAGWLDLREPADAASRAPALTDLLVSRLAPAGELRIADLGSGTGANLRWLAPRLPGVAHWHLLESDPELIRGMRPRLLAWAARHGIAARPEPCGLSLGDGSRVTWQAADLAKEPLPFAAASERLHLVTASALADLVSARWLTRLAERCARHRSAVLLALSYDGRVSLTPSHPLDTRVRDAMNRHQLQDKGFGPALGPGAIAFAAAAFQRQGYRVVQARSDWQLTPADGALVTALLDGWRLAADEILDPEPQAGLDDWQAWHLRQLRCGAASLRVGHVDLLALPEQ